MTDAQRAASLPTRERGSKPVEIAAPLTVLVSLPTRERGSKHFTGIWNSSTRERSLPTRERGSKPAVAPGHLGRLLVAPHAGAWIETRASLMPPSESYGRSPRGSVDRNLFRG